MARPRQSIAVIEAKGRSHLGKAEIERRRASEIKPITDNIIAPTFLTKKQIEKFDIIANQLIDLGIMGETDVDALARYIVAEEFYIHATKQIRKTSKTDPDKLDIWIRIQERLFKQCRASANDLGLTISSRCRLVVPKSDNQTQHENKFAKFVKRK